MNDKCLGLWVAYILVISSLLGGCTRITVSEEEELAAEKFQPDPGYGNVYIVRQMTLIGSVVDIDIKVNGQHIGIINIGTYHLLQLRPGRYTVSAYTNHGGDEEVVDVVEGQNYFIQTEPVTGFFVKASAELIDADLGRKMVVKGSRLITRPVEFREGLSWSVPTSTKWVTGNAQTVKGKYQIIEQVPEGESVQNWTELLTIQNFTSKVGSPELFVEELKALREKTCPGSTTWNVIEKDERSILYEWRAKPCAGYADQHEISRIIDGNWNRFRIAYTAKLSEILAEKRSAMIKSMSEATVQLEQQ